MVVFAGQGDARRTMTLLWHAAESGEARASPGPKPGLSVHVIVDTAIAAVDAEGTDALSMRAVGERLGCSAMALYTYVPGKSELVDLMYDRALGELPTDVGLAAGWRAAVTSWAEHLWAFYLRHPWVLQVSQARPVLGPNEFAHMESLTRILYETGLPASELRGIAGALTNIVRGAVQTIADSRQAATATGMSEDEWWFARSPMLEEVASGFAARFPTVTWLESQKAFEVADDDTPYLEQWARITYESGLTVLLDGVAATMARACLPTSP